MCQKLPSQDNTKSKVAVNISAIRAVNTPGRGKADKTIKRIHEEPKKKTFKITKSYFFFTKIAQHTFADIMILDLFSLQKLI